MKVPKVSYIQEQQGFKLQSSSVAIPTMCGDSDLRGSQRGSLRNLWVIFEMPLEEHSDKEHEEVDYDSISLLSYSEFSHDSCFSLGAPSLSNDTSPNSSNAVKRAPRRSSCKRIDKSSPLHRSNFEATAPMDYPPTEANESNHAGTVFYRVSDRWAPNETANTKDSEGYVPTPKNLFVAHPPAPSGSCGKDALPALKLDHSPRFPTRRVSGGGCTPMQLGSTTTSDMHKPTSRALPALPAEALRLDHCPRIPGRRISVESHPQESSP